MKGWWVTDPWIFYGTAGAVVAYVLYMMIRKRKSERSGVASRDLELCEESGEATRHALESPESPGLHRPSAEPALRWARPDGSSWPGCRWESSRFTSSS